MNTFFQNLDAPMVNVEKKLNHLKMNNVLVNFDDYIDLNIESKQKGFDPHCDLP